MTLENLIGQVLLRVSGGEYSSDSAVKYEDVRHYLPAAVNYALNGSYWAGVGADGDHEVPGVFVSEYTGLSINSSGGKSYVTLPKKKINIGNNRGIRFVEVGGVRAIQIPQGMSHGQTTWNKMFGHISGYQEVGQNVYLLNIPASATTASVGAVTDVMDLLPTDELPIAAGYEPQVIDVCVKFFTDSRFTPKDYIIDGKDID